MTSTPSATDAVPVAIEAAAVFAVVGVGCAVVLWASAYHLAVRG
ncbi:hypothetical protein [Streptomyces sp. GESEQ-35]|nr:hypothetical protein [Streptomyces sp. GESEQ-35]